MMTSSVGARSAVEGPVEGKGDGVGFAELVASKLGLAEIDAVAELEASRPGMADIDSFALDEADVPPGEIFEFVLAGNFWSLAQSLSRELACN
jgi:hypothetical protein